MEEPGSGTVAIIGNKKVSVGTLDWVKRYCSHLSFLLHVTVIRCRKYRNPFHCIQVYSNGYLC